MNSFYQLKVMPQLITGSNQHKEKGKGYKPKKPLA
jgi:hypothetical protein